MTDDDKDYAELLATKRGSLITRDEFDMVPYEKQGRRASDYYKYFLMEDDREDVVQLYESLYPVDFRAMHYIDERKECGFITSNVSLAMKLFQDYNLDFVYDDVTKYFFMDMFARHETFCHALFLYHKHQMKSIQGLSYDDGLDSWIENNMGIIKSSQSRNVICGKDYKIPTEMKRFINRYLERL